MRPEEARWVGETLARLGPDRISPLLEIGSSTLHFRTVEKPHVDALVHAPLRAAGVEIVHCDLKAAPGVDISGDIYDPAIRAQVKAVGARAVLCCNLLEHLTDRARFVGICDELLRPGGVLVITVPYSYPYHLDPIDTLYRPSPEEIRALLPHYELVDAKVIESGSHMTDLRAQGRPWRELAATLWRSLTLRGGLDRTRARLHRLWWLFRPYRLSAVVLLKPGV